MALTRLYFDPSGNALADGTSWTNRAPLITSSGTWSPYIKNFAFSGSDSLECFVGSGSYSCSESFASAIFANAPTYTNPIFLTACDGSGNEWLPPTGWRSCDPVWDTGNMPFVSFTSNTYFINYSFSYWNGFNIYSDTRNGGYLFTGNTKSCIITNTSTGISVGCVSNGSSPSCHDSVFRVTGSGYEACAVGINFHNCRAEGNINATTGTRHGIISSSNLTLVSNNCSSINHSGVGILSTSTGSAAKIEISNCTIDNCVSGVALSSTHPTISSTILNTIITNCDYPININGTGRVFISDTRLRDNTSGVIGSGNYAAYNIITSSGTDAAEYVNTATGDYRIKSTSFLWGKNIGAGDESVSASGGGSTTIICRR